MTSNNVSGASAPPPYPAADPYTVSQLPVKFPPHGEKINLGPRKSGVLKYASWYTAPAEI